LKSSPKVYKLDLAEINETKNLEKEDGCYESKEKE
jgi:hypothetical protein